MHKEVSKYSGIKYLQEKYNINWKDIFSSGDGDNDFEMLKYVKNSFVVSNGSKLALETGKTTINNAIENVIKYGKHEMHIINVAKGLDEENLDVLSKN